MMPVTTTTMMMRKTLTTAHFIAFSFLSFMAITVVLVLHDPQSMTSNFPILIITLPHTLNPRSDDYVNATLDIIYHGPSSYNTIPFPFNRSAITQTLNIGIHVRGQSSRFAAKHQYAIKILDSSGNKEDVGLFGLPAHAKWALYSSNVDHTLMRNMLAFYLSNLMGRYAPRMHYVEMFVVINNETVYYPANYVGVYLLEEKIERGNNTIDIHKMKKDDEGKKSITGGYIFKVDKDDIPSPDEVKFHTNHTKNLYLVYPSGDVVTAAKLDYLTGFLNGFEESLLRGPQLTQYTYSQYIDVDSWVDHFLIQEFTKNIDAYRLSAFFYKDREGKVVAGPVWDLDRTWGNVGDSRAKTPSGWMYDKLMCDTVGHCIPFWWPTLINDTSFVDKVIERWGFLRSSGNALSTSAVGGAIQTFSDAITKTDADRREFKKWGPWYYSFEFWKSGSYFENAVNEMHGWILERLDWMDSNIHNL